MGVPMDELSLYIFTHYERLLTPAERDTHFGMGLFASGGSFGPDRQSFASMSESGEVRELAALGNVEFRQRVVERILREHAADVVLNRCPRCEGLCRTPRARQCFRCGHSWHEHSQAEPGSPAAGGGI
jgi:hypothetical protein